METIPSGPYRSGSKSVADFLQFPLDVWRQKGIIADVMNRNKFDLVYVNGPRLLPAAAPAARGRAPVLFHAHSRLNQRSAVGSAGRSIRQAEATVVACSNYVAHPLERYVGKASLHVIPNGTPDAGFQVRAFGPGRSWRIGLIGRISPEKGQAEFLQAIGLLAPEFPATRFVICGAPIIPADKYLDLVSGLARGLPVEFLGWRDDVPSVLAGLDLLVVPSKDEGLGRVVSEAFSAGVPVVAFASGGIPELITDRETGFLAPEATAEALAAQIREVISADAETVQRVVAKARQAWERSYTVAAYQGRIMELLQRVVSAWRATRETTAPPARR
jgi:glycosyltransferase involved in cell wall biosynthesis